MLLTLIYKGVTIRLLQERAEMERRSQEEHLRLMRTETERLQAETERIKVETRRLEEQQKRAVESVATDIDEQIRAALNSLRLAYPDLELHLPRMSKSASSFELGDSSTVSVRDYLEGLYVISKFAPFASSEKSPSAVDENKR